jgi:hypothetical protein
MKKFLHIAAFIAYGGVATAQTTLSTYPTILPNNNFDQILFEMTPNQNIMLESVDNAFNIGSGTVEVFVKVGGYTNPPGAVNALNGWVSLGTAPLTTTNINPVPVPIALNYLMNSGVTYGVAISGGTTTIGSQYHTHVASDPTFYSNGVVTIEVGPIKGWGGAVPTPGNNPRDFVGSITYSLVSTAPNDAGVSEILEPGSNCVGVHPVEVELTNFGTNQITTVEVNWSINGVLQSPYTHTTTLDTIGGTGSNKDTVVLGNITLTAGVTDNIKAWTKLPNNQMDTVYINDTSLVAALGYAFPTINLGPDTTICPAENAVLNAGTGRDSVRWSTNATTPTLTVNSTGLYYVTVYENGCASKDSLTIAHYPPAPTVNLGPDTTICKGDSIVLDATTAGVTYLWQDGSTGPTFSVKGTGAYSVTLEDGNTCNSTDGILVGVYSDPAISQTVSPGNSICYGVPYSFKANGFSQGSIMYQWKINGVNSGSLTADPNFSPSLNYGDTVSVDLVTDLCVSGTVAIPSNEIIMFINPAPRSINGADTVIENTTSAYVVGLSTNSYAWSVVGGTIASGSTGNVLTVNWGGPNTSASVICTETDNLNCSYPNEKAVVVVSIVGVNENNERITMGKAYPNPANSSISIPFMSNGPWDVELNLYDITGKQVKSIYSGDVSGSKTVTFAVDDLKSGLYYCQISTKDGYTSVKKIVVQH